MDKIGPGTHLGPLAQLAQLGQGPIGPIWPSWPSWAWDPFGPIGPHPTDIQTSYTYTDILQVYRHPADVLKVYSSQPKCLLLLTAVHQILYMFSYR